MKQQIFNATQQIQNDLSASITEQLQTKKENILISCIRRVSNIQQICTKKPNTVKFKSSSTTNMQGDCCWYRKNIFEKKSKSTDASKAHVSIKNYMSSKICALIYY